MNKELGQHVKCERNSTNKKENSILKENLSVMVAFSTKGLNIYMENKVDHIGIAVHSIEKALLFYVDDLKLDLLGFEEVTTQLVKVAFLHAGNTKIELLEPTSDNSPIAKFLAKKGEGIHHIAFGVKDIESRLQEIKENGLPLIDEKPRQGAAGMEIAFIHPKAANNVLIELCEKKRGER